MKIVLRALLSNEPSEACAEALGETAGPWMPAFSASGVFKEVQNQGETAEELDVARLPEAAEDAPAEADPSPPAQPA